MGEQTHERLSELIYFSIPFFFCSPLKKNGRRPKKKYLKNEDDIKIRMKTTLRKKWEKMKTTSKKMKNEDDLKQNKNEDDQKKMGKK